MSDLCVIVSDDGDVGCCDEEDRKVLKALATERTDRIQIREKLRSNSNNSSEENTSGFDEDEEDRGRVVL